MATIPPHYTDRFIVQRYNKALHFVQHLPASSNFQPTKSQKLELYALYKQVSQGDINTQRPGLFDVVGRAKWDAWKKLEGISTLEARHTYVEALLRVAAEAYKKNVGREEAQQIIHTFAIMRPSGDEDSDSLVDDTDDTTSNQEDDEDDTASEDAEEQAYLRDIQKTTMSDNTTPYGSPDKRRVQRPPSVASVNTMVTAPMTLRPSTSTSTQQSSRPASVASLQNSIRQNRNRPQHLTTNNDHQRVLPKYEEFDDSINPWQHIPTFTRTEDGHVIRKTPSNPQLRQNKLRLTSSLSAPSPPPQLQSMTPIYQSPMPGSSASSSVTATPQLHNTERAYTPDSRSTSRNQQYTSVVALGPATKRALESLQNEVIALNERIDDLRRELVGRDKQRAIARKVEEDDDATDDMGDSWKWVIKAALKYAGVNLMTVFILFLILYKTKSPIAYAILKQFSKLWQAFKLHVLISNIVV